MAGETRKFDQDNTIQVMADPAIKPIDLGMPVLGALLCVLSILRCR